MQVLEKQLVITSFVGQELHDPPTISTIDTSDFLDLETP